MLNTLPFFIALSLLLAYSHAAYCQIGNNFCGTYRFMPTKKANQTLYSPLIFDGKGKVYIGAGAFAFQADYCQTNDSIIIIPNKDVLVFKRTKKKGLVGSSFWVDKERFKYVSNDTMPCHSPVVSEEAGRQAELLYRYYKAITTVGDTANLVRQLEMLCDANLSPACLGLANYKVDNFRLKWMRENVDMLLKQVIKPADITMPHNEKIEQLYQKAIGLNNPNAPGKLSDYYLLTEQPLKACAVLKEACEKGNENYCTTYHVLESVLKTDSLLRDTERK